MATEKKKNFKFKFKLENNEDTEEYEKNMIDIFITVFYFLNTGAFSISQVKNLVF